jgi:hypothetical protein
MRLNGLLLVAACLMVSIVACTSAHLMAIPPAEGPYARQKIQADLCAPDALSEAVPYKILFVIDTSYSNSWNDPQGRRAAAVRNAITAHLGEATVSFGVITFSDAPRVQTFGFTRDLMILNGAVQNIAIPQGGTNYSDTMWAMSNFVLADANNLSVEEKARTHYLIYWLSDGMPTVGVTDQTALVPGVTYLRQQLESQVAELKFNSAYLGGVPPTTPDEMAGASALLHAMANAGAGTFDDIPSGAGFTFAIDPRPLLTAFSLQGVVAYNQNAMFAPGEPTADTDADGLSDDTETQHGLDPGNRDTDGDGLSDGVEWLLPSQQDPATPDNACTSGATDTDGDGLNDCEEKLLGTFPNNPDTDGDGLIDSVEVLHGSSPLSADPQTDTDLDGMPDHTEVLLHLPARVPNTPDEWRDWGYTYEASKIESATPTDGPPCYHVTVSNVSMAETPALAPNPAGSNVLQLIATFTTGGPTSKARVFRAQMQGLFHRPDAVQPATGIFALEAKDFAELK